MRNKLWHDNEWIVSQFKGSTLFVGVLVVERLYKYPLYHLTERDELYTECDIRL